ncbi:universal stress protein [sulfur-oxidizing endosymbiont of Gigantopelta aegis]|uniref:universal stress protein n=1 Tax=sulfur-oxidizing endosymbiont of Gigantopelta aegis TaxID=2794934 RepID=UPI0018DE4905|nr:universal stress protein [sulfur-oxidizing endosymbiont of Gigantopelta aegis]
MKNFKNILFIADAEMQCRPAFERAMLLAENNQANLTVATIVDELPGYYPQLINGELSKQIKDEHLKQIENLVASVSHSKKVRVITKLLVGKPFLAIIHEVLTQKIELVIKTVDKETFMSRLFGSSDMSLLRECPCPVWLLKSSVHEPYKKLMVAIDFDPMSTEPVDEQLNRQILNMSLSLALSEFSELHIVHVWSAYGESGLRTGFAKQPKKDVDAYVNEIRVKHETYFKQLVSSVIDEVGKEVSDYIKPQVHLIKGNARDKIPEFAKKEEVDLILMGTLARTGVSGLFMGNTSETILSQIDCSILAVKPEGFVSPVA